MEYKDGWYISDNSLINTVGNFGVAIDMEIEQEGTPPDFPFEINQGDIRYTLTVYNVEEIKKTHCFFPSLDEAVYFVDNYVAFSKNIFEVSMGYFNYCVSEYACNHKGYVS